MHVIFILLARIRIIILEPYALNASPAWLLFQGMLISKSTVNETINNIRIK